MSDIPDAERFLKAFAEVELGPTTHSCETSNGYIVQIRQSTYWDCSCKDFINRCSWTGTACKHLIRFGAKVGFDLVGWEEISDLMKELAVVEDETDGKK